MEAGPITRNRLKEIARLSRRSTRDETAQCLIEGLRSVEGAVEAGAPLEEVVVVRDLLEDDRVLKLLARAAAPVYTASSADVSRASDTRTAQGILAVARVERFELDQIEPPMVALDGVQDPGNVGAIVRSAAWFGARSLVVGAGTADPFSPKAIRAAMGGIWDLRVAAVDDLPDALSSLSDRSLAVYGADLEGVPLPEWQPALAGVLVLGSEAHGLSESVRQIVQQRVRIGGSSRARGAESLNAAVAAGILLHSWLARDPETT